MIAIMIEPPRLSGVTDSGNLFQAGFVGFQNGFGGMGAGRPGRARLRQQVQNRPNQRDHDREEGQQF
jgi:hypothetical protein